MKKKFIVLGLLASAMFSCAVFASTGTQNISATYDNIKIVVDGRTVNASAEPFIYNGVTYLPVRAVGEALGKEVSWDSSTNTIYLGDVPKTENSQQDNNAQKDTFVVSNVKREYMSGIGMYKVFGEITNNYDKYYDFVGFSLNFYNGDNLLSTGSGIVNNIGAGETKTFELYVMSDISSATKYKLQIDSAINYNDFWNKYISIGF